jgi:hypothetical protein
LGARLRSQKGELAEYLLVGHGQSELLILSHGKIMLRISAPSAINCMCAGSFWATETGPDAEAASDNEDQVIFGGEDGILYRLRDWKLVPLAEVCEDPPYLFPHCPPGIQT